MPSATFTGEERGEDEGPHSDGVVAVATEEDSNSCVVSAVGEDDGVSGGGGDGGGGCVLTFSCCFGIVKLIVCVP